MITIHDFNEPHILPITVHSLVQKVMQIATYASLQDRTCIAVIEASDREEAVTAALGWNPLHNPIDGIRYDDTEFVPYWAWLELHGGWYRLVHTVGNDGFAYELLIEARGEGPFHTMCRRSRGDSRTALNSS